jgi:hypothetical protein
MRAITLTGIVLLFAMLPPVYGDETDHDTPTETQYSREALGVPHESGDEPMMYSVMP